MRKLATFAAAFSAAVFAWRYGLWPLALVGAAVCLIGLVCSGRGHDPNRRLFFGLLLAGIAAALAWCALFYALTLAPWVSWHKEEDVGLTVSVESYPTVTERGQPVVTSRIVHPETGKGTDGLIYLPPGSEAEPGDTLAVVGALYLADRVGQDEVTYYSAKGAFLRVYVSEIEAVFPHGSTVRFRPAEFARQVKRTLYDLLREDAAPLAVAITTGDKSGLTDHFMAMSRRAGLAHVMVISGMHISFLAGWMGVFLGRRRRWAVVVTLTVLVFFALMAGGTPSAWRAVFLCAAGLIAPLVGRENDPPTSLLTALMLLLLANPYSAASLSLQFSFAAVAGIELLTPALLRRWSRPRPKGALARAGWRLRRALAAGLAVSLGAILLTAPLSGAYFGMVSLISPVSNLCTLWAVSGSFTCSAMAAAAGMLAPVLGGLFAALCTPFLQYLLWSVPLLGSLPFAAITTTSDYYALGLLALYAIVCLTIFWPSEGKKRLSVPIGCAVVLCVVCVVLTRLEVGLSDLTVAVLDVGQGQSVCLHAGDKTILVDCGGTGYSNPGDVAADYLADLGIDTVDLLVLTHYHADHASGVPELMTRLKVRELALPDVDPEDPLRLRILAEARQEGAEVTYITSNTTYPMGMDARVTLYAPLGDGGVNERGLTALTTAGDYDVLITGDMNGTVEKRLVKYGDLPDVELLVVSHHGSKHSTSQTLLDAVTPEAAVISVGENNSYGHPAQETLERLAEGGATIYRTDLSGTVVLRHQRRK